MKDTLKKFREHKFSEKEPDGRWYNLWDIINKIPDSRYEKLRKFKFLVRADEVICASIQQRKHLHDLGELSIGKRYSVSAVNIYPKSHPNKYITAHSGRIELYIPNEVYRTKILPLILANDEKS